MQTGRALASESIDDTFHQHLLPDLDLRRQTYILRPRIDTVRTKIKRAIEDPSAAPDW